MTSPLPIPPPPRGGSTADVEAWNQYASRIAAAINESAGWEREKLKAQYDDAMKGRANAYRMAQLEAQTSRYGVDARTQTELAQLRENARQFDANHGLDQARFGLDYAKTATDYLSTPDRFFQAGDFIDAGGRMMQGSGPQPYGATGTPQAKTWEDFGVLANYPGGSGGGGAPAAVAGGGGGGGGASSVDPREKALRAVYGAIPPSPGPGLTSNDGAALEAARAIYSSNLRPGSLEKLRPGQQAMLGSAGRRLGYDVKDWEADYRRSLPGQGRPGSAY